MNSGPHSQRLLENGDVCSWSTVQAELAESEFAQ